MPYNCRGCDNCYTCLGTFEPKTTFCRECNVLGHASGSATCHRMYMSRRMKELAEEAAKRQEPSDLLKRIAELERKESDLEQVRATILVNFNNEYGERFGLVLEDKGSTPSLMDKALQHLAKPWIENQQQEEA